MAIVCSHRVTHFDAVAMTVCMVKSAVTLKRELFFKDYFPIPGGGWITPIYFTAECHFYLLRTHKI